MTRANRLEAHLRTYRRGGFGTVGIGSPEQFEVELVGLRWALEELERLYPEAATSARELRARSAARVAEARRGNG